MRSTAWALVACVGLHASTATGERLTPDVVAALAPDVGEGEWLAAVPAETIHAGAPQRVDGPISPGDPDVPAGATARVVLDVVYRTDGTVGLYRIRKVTHLKYALQMMSWLRAQRFRPFLKDGFPVAVRGKQEFVGAKPQVPIRRPSN